MKAGTQRHRSIYRFGRHELLEKRDLLAGDTFAIEPVHTHEHSEHEHSELVDYDVDSLPGELVDPANPLLRVDSLGNQFYFDPAPHLDTIDAQPADMVDTPNGEGGPQFLPPTVPIYHSNPSSTNKILLDFDGQIVSGTSWNQYNNGNPIHAPAYSLDGNLESFSSTELSRIEETWLRVAEDYVGFDVDVTTEDPGSAYFAQGGQGIRVIISTDRDASTGNQWFGGAGGVAFLNSWNWTSDTPVWVFENNLGTTAKSYAEAASHEAGHAFGLSHDGVQGGNAYYAGHGSGTTGWAPIMGVGYNRNLSQWSRGEYTNANNGQNDITIIRNDLGYRTDDHSNSTTSTTAATPVSISGLNLFGDGIIHNESDVDVFSITLNGGGNFSVNADPVSVGPNLDIEMTIYDQDGSFIASNNPTSDIDASVTLNGLSGGIYLVMIDGVGKGNPATAYSDYGSIGAYTLSGTVQITNPNTSPSAGDDEYSVTEDTTLTIVAPGLLENDSDPNDDPLTVLLDPVTDVSHGNLTLAADGSFIYTPDDNFSGTDSFVYQAYDGNGGVGNGTVTITVDAVNDEPVAINDSYSLVQGGSFTASLGIDDLLFNDSDADDDSLTVNSTPVSDVSNGILTLGTDGTFTYTPTNGFHGTDSFTYEITDGNGGMTTADVAITVEPFASSCENPAPNGILRDGHTDLMYNPVTGLMTIRIDSAISGDGVNAIIIAGPDALDYSPEGAPIWGAAAYFSDQVQLIIYNNDLFAGLETDLPLLQYATGLTEADFGCVEFGNIGDTSIGNASRAMYTNVTVITDTAAPSATTDVADVTVAGTTSHTFDVTFNDNVAIQNADLATGTVLVTGPNGYSEIATVNSVTPSGDAAAITASLTISAAGGSWDVADEGTYTVSIVDFTVTDTSNNFLAGGDIGTFEVDLSGTTTPGDFDNDGDFDCDDVDMLSEAIIGGSTNSIFDLDTSGSVDVQDLNYWVTEIKGTLLGDANLDFNVDGADFLIWNANKFESGKAWCTGDFDGNGTVDGSDFLIWNAWKFQTPDAGAVNLVDATDAGQDTSDNPVAPGNATGSSSDEVTGRFDAATSKYERVSIISSVTSADDREEQGEEQAVDYLFAELGSL